MLFMTDEILSKNNKMKILQFTPYFSPHKWWLEKIAETISKYLVEGKYCEVINITSSIDQKKHLQTLPKIIYKNKHIWYKIDNYKVISVPSFEIVHNFPCPKFWKPEFRTILQYIKFQKPDIIQTHTRFFLQTMMGWLITKRLKKQRVHIEHGSGYVAGYSFYIRLCANLFDMTIGRRIFRQSDKIVTISKNNIPFIKKFTKKDIIVIYNPIDYVPQKKIENKIPHIGFVGRLVPLKWVDLLIKALKLLENIEWKCTIVGEWNHKQYLEKLTKDLQLWDRITFVGVDDRANRLHTFDIFINPSYQEGLPTTVIEALLAKCIVVATDVGGTKEISDKDDLFLVQSGNITDLSSSIKKALNIYTNISWLSLKLTMNTFNYKTSTKSYYSLYNQLLHEKH